MASPSFLWGFRATPPRRDDEILNQSPQVHVLSNKVSNRQATSGFGQLVIGFSLLVGLALPFALTAELNPWAGNYEVVSVERGQGNWEMTREEDAKLASVKNYTWVAREFIEIRTDGYLKAGGTWTCGAERDVVDGDAIFKKDRIDLIERPFPGQERTSSALIASLELRPGRRIAFEAPLDEFRKVKLVFARVENAPTWLDWFGFR